MSYCLFRLTFIGSKSGEKEWNLSLSFSVCVCTRLMINEALHFALCSWRFSSRDKIAEREQCTTANLSKEIKLLTRVLLSSLASNKTGYTHTWARAITAQSLITTEKTTNLIRDTQQCDRELVSRTNSRRQLTLERIIGKKRSRKNSKRIHLQAERGNIILGLVSMNFIHINFCPKLLVTQPTVNIGASRVSFKATRICTAIKTALVIRMRRKKKKQRELLIPFMHMESEREVDIPHSPTIFSVYECGMKEELEENQNFKFVRSSSLGLVWWVMREEEESEKEIFWLWARFSREILLGILICFVYFWG